MSSAMRARLDAEIEALTPLVRKPTEPFYWGAAISCVTDLDPRGTYLPSDTTEGIAQECIRRITTSRGSLIDSQEACIDVRGYVNKGVTETDLANIGTSISAEFERVEQVAFAAVRVTYVFETSELLIKCQLTTVDPEIGEFNLVFAVTGGAEMVRILSEF